MGAPSRPTKMEGDTGCTTSPIVTLRPAVFSARGTVEGAVSNGTWICDSPSEAASTGKFNSPALAELTRAPTTLTNDPGAAGRLVKSAALTSRRVRARCGAVVAN